MILEPPFVGPSRQALVAGLVTIFDAVNDEGEPRWVALEAPTGWGKTRVVHELFRELAATRQGDPAYWPPSILAAANDPEVIASPEGRRKRVYPERWEHPAAAVPNWFWWGIACSHRSGEPAQALANDLTQFATHEAALERRWKQLASRPRRIRDRVARRGRDATSAVAQDAISAAVPVPGLGLGLLLARWGVQRVTGALREGKRRAMPIEEVSAQSERLDLVGDLESALVRLATVGLPIVIFVEDLHRADSSLVELLARILSARSGNILVITTSWPGSLDDDRLPANRLLARAPTERVLRVGHAWATPKGLPETAGLGSLDHNDLQAVAAHCLPGADSFSLALLAHRFSHPLAIEVACGLGRIRRHEDASGQVHLEPSDVAELPTELRSLYEIAWRELPTHSRNALSLAALATPDSVSERWGAGDDRWDIDLVATAIRESGLLQDEIDSLVQELDHDGTTYSWARRLGEWSRRFNETDQCTIAINHARDEYADRDIGRFHTKLSELLLRSPTLSPDRRAFHARLLMALHAEGYVAPTQQVLEAYQLLLADTLIPLRAPQYQLALATAALGVAKELELPSEMYLDVRSHEATAVARAGRVDEGIDRVEALLDDQRRILGPDHPNVLTTRSNLAFWLGTAGRVDEAIERFETLLEDRRRILGPDHPNVLTTRSNLAALLSMSGRVDEAIERFETLLEDRRRILGPDHIDVLNTRNNLATSLGRSGRVDEAIERFEALLEDRRRILGPDHPNVLTTRGNLATSLGEAGRLDDAIERLETLLDDQLRILGPDHPDVLNTRNILALWLGRGGRLDDAIERLEALLQDQRRVLGPDHPNVLTTRNNLATSLGEAGDDVVERFETLLDDRRRILGPDHPDVLATRNNLATLLGSAGRVDDAIERFETLLDDQRRILGPDHPDVLTTRNNLAFWLGRAGRVDDAIERFETLLDDQRRILGLDHPDVLTTRNNLATLLSRAGRLDDAIERLEALLQDQRRVLGPDHPNVLTTRNNLATLLGEAGHIDDAIERLEALLDDRQMILGPDHPDVLTTRNNLATSLTRAGRVDDAIERFETLLDDQRRILGPDHPNVLTTRNNLATSLGEAGQIDQAIERFETLLDDQRRILGPDHPNVHTTRNKLSTWLERRYA